MRTILFSLFGALLLMTAGCSKNNAGTPTPDSGKGGSLARFTIVGNYMYVVNSKQLKAYDVSTPGAPVFKNEVSLGWDIETIFPYDGNLFVGSSTGLYICSLADPASPKLAGQVQHLRACDPVVATGNTAYVTLRAGTGCGGTQNALMVYDVADIRVPRMLRSIALSGPYGLGVSGTALYVCDGINGLLIYDISTREQPNLEDRIYGHDFRDVIPHRGVLIAQLANGVAFYDISRPRQPALLSTLLH
ncbi:LVIVD repeat-containing protein [Chitinophaga alhagiae]|uniref:LVIVD repeat-containing protein n=1 Tax=Chitinophaga alhagiae TaxID=2203219 RepID=UPI000E5C1299|nr:hypothetical protein [Chitinophaga alhagiae]